MKRLREWFFGLSERERRMFLVLGAVFVAFAVLLIPYGSSAMLGSKRERNKSFRDAIRLVHNSRGRLGAAKARRDAITQRYANKAPPLAGFIENAARQSGVEIPESRDRADIPHGKKFVERSTVVRLRRVGMLPLVKVLERLENSKHPIVISRLNIRSRGQENDSYDVELGVSAYDRVKAESKDSSPKSDSSAEAP